jgi:hypothetical protein
MNDDPGAGSGKRAGRGAADAARCASNKCSSADEVGHSRSPVWDEKMAWKIYEAVLPPFTLMI